MRIAFTFNLKVHAGGDQAEFDTPETVTAIEAGLRSLGHDVEPIEVSGAIGEIITRLDRANPDLIFNTADGGAGRSGECLYPALFERMGIPHTGSVCAVCATCTDKHLTKLIVSQRGVPTPSWRFVHVPSDAANCTLRFPVIVKPNFESRSTGISSKSVVENQPALDERVAAELARFPEGLVVEEFIAGRDVVAPYLESASPETGGVLEPAEYVYKAHAMPYAIIDDAMKAHGLVDVSVKVPAELTPQLREQMFQMSREAVATLGVRDLARLDFRVSDDGRLYFLEINALPSLEPGASIYLSGAHAGLDGVPGVLEAVVRSAIERDRARSPSAQ